jgi:hypothetical protein
MARPTIQEFNLETQETIIREMNDAEYEQHLIDVVMFEEQTAKQAEENAAEAAKAEAKKQTLAALGLSQEVINLLAE